MDYDSVIKFKLLAIREIYAVKKELLKNDTTYLEFFELNRSLAVMGGRIAGVSGRYRKLAAGQKVCAFAGDGSEIGLRQGADQPFQIPLEPRKALGGLQPRLVHEEQRDVLARRAAFHGDPAA